MMDKHIKEAGEMITRYITGYVGTGLTPLPTKLNINEWQAKIQIALKEVNQKKKEVELKLLLDEAINYLEKAHMHFKRNLGEIEALSSKRVEFSLQSPDLCIAGLKEIFKDLKSNSKKLRF